MIKELIKLYIKFKLNNKLDWMVSANGESTNWEKLGISELVDTVFLDLELWFTSIYMGDHDRVDKNVCFDARGPRE